MMIVVKTFRVKGEMKKEFRTLPFSKEIRDIDEKRALEKIYDDLGSRNKLNRKLIKIISIEEIDPKEAKNLFIRQIVGV